MTQTIEQLTARVRELEEENARLVKLDAKRKKQLSDFDDVIDDLNVVVSCINPVEDLKRAIAALKEQAAASQAYAEQLREKIEALWDIIDDIDSYGDMAKADDKLFRSLVEKRQKDRWETCITTDGYVLNMPIPRDTSALDAYIAEKVKEESDECSALNNRLAKLLAETAVALKGEESALTRHSWHDLPVIALAKMVEIATLTQQRDLAVETLHHISLCSQNSMSSQRQCGELARAAIKESKNNKAS